MLKIYLLKRRTHNLIAENCELSQKMFALVLFVQVRLKSIEFLFQAGTYCRENII